MGNSLRVGWACGSDSVADLDRSLCSAPCSRQWESKGWDMDDMSSTNEADSSILSGGLEEGGGGGGGGWLSSSSYALHRLRRGIVSASDLRAA